MKLNEVEIFCEICMLSWIYSYVAVCGFCSVRCVIAIDYIFLFYIYSTYILFNISFMFLLLFCMSSVLCIVSSSVYSCLFPIFVQVYRPLSTGGNPVAVYKYFDTYLLIYLLTFLLTNLLTYLLTYSMVQSPS